MLSVRTRAKPQLWLCATHRRRVLIVTAISEKYGSGETFWEIGGVLFIAFDKEDQRESSITVLACEAKIRFMLN